VRHSLLWPFAGLMSALAIVPASAQSLGERQAQAEAQERYAEVLAATNTACGTEISGGFNWAGFREEDYTPQLSLHGWCSAPLDAMRNLCTEGQTEIARAAIADGISEVICARGDERGIALENGVLTYTVNFQSANDFFDMRDWLRDNL